ncbi:MAG: aldo/keto reductase [Bacteroidales bacterium]|nr:aldo/keto reductase [Bacteroidales bacterium]
MSEKNINRRDFIKLAGTSAAVTAVAMSGCGDNVKTEKIIGENITSKKEIPTDKMTYRTNPKTGDKISVLGYGFMRLPTVNNQSARENGQEEIDQEQVNRLTDFAIEHGLNLFDTSPAYCQGRSEHSMGIALSRHPRNKYFISTKLSNFAPPSWSREASIGMYQNSLKELQTEYLDYLHLHGIGMGANFEGKELSGLEAFDKRYIENGVLDYLMKERQEGRIKNLGFSYHGDVKVFDYLVDNHDKWHWDFAMIQMNYVDWKYAKKINPRNTDAEYLYNRLTEKGIPVFIMEPILGGRLAKLPTHLSKVLRERIPENSIASWSFRWIATHKNVLTILSGMTYMEHLQDNLSTLCPLQECTDEENNVLQRVADEFVNFPLVPCTQCQYCMPCPYGVDIPGSFTHYNKCVNEGYIAVSTQDKDFVINRKRFLIGYDRKVDKKRQAAHCIGCGVCMPHCPQGIQIPERLTDINNYIEKLRQEKL